MIIADLVIGTKLIGSLASSEKESAKKSNQTSSTIAETEYIDEEMTTVYDSVLESGDVIDLIDDDVVSCVCGESDAIYESSELDEYKDGVDNPDDYYQSNYGKYYTKLLTCDYSENAEEVSFSLNKEYSKLFFTIGLWDCANEDTSSVIIYKGMNNNKKEICRAKRSPGQPEGDFSVNVSDCDVITIKLVSPDYGGNLVTNGFKLERK